MSVQKRRLICGAVVGLLLNLSGITYAQPQSWVEESFEDFADGTLDAGGQNIYVSRDGKIRTINRFDLNSDGHLDLLFNCTHNTYQMLPATIGVVQNKRQTRNRPLAVEGSQRVATADLNNDGFTDVVICPNAIGVHHNRRFLSIAWGGPDGWSPHRITSALPMHSAAAIAIADLNRDGLPDIAVLGATRWRVDQPAGRIIRLFWNSSGGFSAIERQDIGVDGAIDIAAGDFDDDGSGDLAVLKSGGRIDLFWAAKPTAQQHVKFVPSELVLPGGDAICLTAADANADRTTDLVAGSSAKRIYLLPADTKRTWKKPLAIPASPASHVAVGDLDGDGQPDLALTKFSSARASGGEQAGAGREAEDVVQILWGDPSGFDAKRSTPLKARTAVATAIGDLDGDGRPDLTIAIHQGDTTFAGESIVYFGRQGRELQRGTNGFRTSGTTDVTFVPAEKQLPARVIFCNSIGGQLDEAVPLHVYWGGDKGFDAKRLWKIPFHSGYEGSAADLNADGYVDLIALNSGHAHVGGHEDATLGANIFWGSAKGFDLKKRRSVIHEHFLGTSSVADLNRDGWLDLVLEPFAPAESGEIDRLYIYYGAANGFDKSRRVSLPKQGYSQEHVVADFNNDGWLDIAHTSRHFNTVRILWGGADGFDVKQSRQLKVPGVMGLSTADLNADGFLDLYVSTYNDPTSGYRDMGSLIFWGNGDGYRHSNAQWLPGFSPLGRTIADFDGDGYLDLFSPQHSGELTREDLACHLYWGSKEGFATRRRTTLFCDSVNDSVAGDFNGDGRLDLAVACHTRHGDHRTVSRVFYNDGRRFDNPRVQKLPTNGTHLMWALDIGHIADRKYRQTYTSSVFEWSKAAQRVFLETRSERPPGTKLTFSVRTAATKAGLSRAEWNQIARKPVALEAGARFLQYRADFQSDNGDRYPVLDRVKVVVE